MRDEASLRRLEEMGIDVYLPRHASAGEVYKVLVVDVKPDHSYRIGARLLRDRLDAASIRDNAYWEPVVWSSVAERCR